jgi:hypothetical protein
MKYITKPQLAKFHVLLSNLGIMDQKQHMVYNITEGRATSSKDLSFDEATLLIKNLSQYDPKQRIKSTIFSLAYKAGIIYGETEMDKKMNTAKLNAFIRDRGAVKKELNEMNMTELNKVHRQFEAIVRNTNNASDKKTANKLVKNLLEDLNLTAI